MPPPPAGIGWHQLPAGIGLRFGDRLHPLNTCDIYIYEDIGFGGCLNYCNLKFVWVRLKYKTTHGSEAEPPPK